MRLRLIWWVGALMLMAIPAAAQSTCDLTPQEKQVYKQYFGTAEPPGAPIPADKVRGFANKTTRTYRVLGSNASLSRDADQSARFWQAVANAQPECWPDLVFIRTTAADVTAHHTFSLDSVLQWECYGQSYPLSNGAGFDWETEDCDGHTYTNFDMKFTATSRYLARHQWLHEMVLHHTRTTGGILKGIADKKQTCAWLATPELDAANPCWNPIKTSTVDFFKVWRFALRQVPGSSTVIP